MNMPSSLPQSLTNRAAGAPIPWASLARATTPTLGAYVNVIRARKGLVIGLTLLITLIAAVAVNLMTPIYRASATILIEENRSKVFAFQDLVGVSPAGREFFQTQAEFIKSREVGSRVLQALGLTTNEYFDPRQRKPSKIALWLSQLPLIHDFAEPASPRSYTEEEVEEIALAHYKNNLDVIPVRLSQLVQIRYEGPDPFLAARIANQTAESYVTADLDARFNMQQVASKWLNERLDSLRKELEKSEKALQTYRESIGLISTPDTSMGGNIRQLDTTAEKLIIARIERSQAEQVYNQVRRGAPNRYEVPMVFNNPAVVTARAAEAIAEKKVADAAQALGSAHPVYQAALTELESARENTKRQSEGVIASIAKQYEVAKSTERALETALANSRESIQDINRKEGRLNVLERDVATNQQIYQTFLAKVKETDATSDFRNPIARVVDAAVAPLEPVKPAKPLVISLAAFLGALLAASIVIAMDQKTAVIRSTDEVLDKLNVPLLTATPKVTGKQLTDLARIQHHEPQSMFSEAVRSALTGVRLSLPNAEKAVIGVTSTLPGEGKSTLALSLAIEQARTKRTLLIEADLRKPAVGRMLELPSDRLGLTALLQGAPLEHCVQFAADLNLSIVVAGDHVKNPHDLLMSSRFVESLNALKARFDFIVIDTPPLEMVSDALPIGLQCTGMIYVVKAEETLIPLAKRGLERIQSARIQTLGIMLNAHNFERAGKYYGEYSAYGLYGKAPYGEKT